jgi:amidohydrolase
MNTAELTKIRHDLHRHPELSSQEVRTSAFVAERLQAYGVEVRRGAGGMGVVGKLGGSGPGKTLALRADMDALPLSETNSLPYRSENSGVMHACGHDGHTTILLGVAEELARRRERLSGKIVFLFQPAEETGQGAKRMIAEGALDGADAIAALHGWPPLPVGQIGVRAGAMTASADTLEILIHGQGAHAAYPHLGVDPIVAAAQVILGLQTISSRETEPTEPIVVSITQVQSGTAANIIPETVRLAGTLRAHSPAIRAGLIEQIRRICDGICSAHRCRNEVHLSDGNPPVINDAALVELLTDAASAELGAGNVIMLPKAAMGAEDFAEYLQQIPGVFFRLGLGIPTPLHSPAFDFTDAALPVGVEVLTAFALRYLNA